jgi:bacteriocin biosynthesis cyclodehydratase domain-containing protein
MSAYRKSPEWTLLLEADQLVASAGADELYLVDEVQPAEARALHRAFGDDTLAALPAAYDAILRKLERLGAIVRAQPVAGPRLRASVRSAGGSDAAAAPVAAAIAAAIEADADGGLARVDEREAELVVWVRGAGTLFDAIGGEAYARLRTPHLFVDLAYHHTISIGPLVWPGETACLGCLTGRIRHTWGDPEPPPAPRASAHAGLAAALVLEQLREFRRSGSCPTLVERTVSLNPSTLETRSERVHRLPWCPFCFPAETPYGAGSFALPWVRA